MENEPRKASQVLLELEAKIDNLTNLVVSQNFANQLLSNKISELLQSIKSQKTYLPNITAEAANTAPQIPVSPMDDFISSDPEREFPVFAENKLPEVSDLLGYRRTSRQDMQPENNLKQTNVAPHEENGSMQSQKLPITREQVANIQKQEFQPKSQIKKSDKVVIQNAVPVIQRVVSSAGKSVFLAKVEIIDKATSKLVLNTKTGSTGKWTASLSPGNYQVAIRKIESQQQPKMEVIQNIQVDGKVSPYELPTVTLK